MFIPEKNTCPLLLFPFLVSQPFLQTVMFDLCYFSSNPNRQLTGNYYYFFIADLGHSAVFLACSLPESVWFLL